MRSVCQATATGSAHPVSFPRVVVVTGAAGGIGRAASVEFADAGWSVVLVDRDRPGLDDAAAAAAGSGADVQIVEADVSQADDVRGYVEAALSRFGRVDALFNNAGIEGPPLSLVDYAVEQFDRVLAVNVRGVFLGLRYALPVMIAQGSGTVVNTASTNSFVSFPGSSAYDASKHAVLGLTRTTAGEVGPSGVRVNAICPGTVDTRLMRAYEDSLDADPATVREEVEATIPLRRYADPAEIARLVRFLCSDDASYINGSAVVIDGGFLAVR
jgi:NAD(P)-dependent dehydrogenase (short-subunit alcohol dehydrogenase family)